MSAEEVRPFWLAADIDAAVAQPSTVDPEQELEAPMSARYLPILMLACAFPVATVAQNPADAASRLVVKPAAELEWADLDPGVPGSKVVELWGNRASGAFGALFRLPAGFAAPLHTHTHDMKVVILSGTYIQSPDGKPEFRLGPGSYFMQPGGDYRHITRCDPAADCVFFVESQGAFDLKLAEPAR